MTLTSGWLPLLPGSVNDTLTGSVIYPDPDLEPGRESSPDLSTPREPGLSWNCSSEDIIGDQGEDDRLFNV